MTREVRFIMMLEAMTFLAAAANMPACSSRYHM